MLYELMLIGGGVWLTSVVVSDVNAQKKQTQNKQKKENKPKKRIKLADLSDVEKWKYFIKVKTLHKDQRGTQYEKELEKKLIEAERLLQNKEKGFYLGDSVELGVESSSAERKPLYLPWQNLFNHFIIYGTTRFGKTRALANHMRQFIDAGYNVIIIDPKGGENQEILSWMAEFANSSNRLDDFMFFNPVFPNITDYFNPLFGKENDEIASDMKLYAMGDPKAKSDFFIQRVPQIIKAIATGCEYMEKVLDPDGRLVKAQLEEEVTKYLRSRIVNGHKVIFEKESMTMNPDVAFRSQERVVEMPEKISAQTFKRKLMTYKDFAHFAVYENLISLYDAVKSTPISNVLSAEKQSEMMMLRDEAIVQISGAAGTSKEHYEKTTGSLIELLNKLSTGSVGRMFCSTPINPLVLRLQSEDKGILAVVQPNPLKYQSVSEMIMKIFLKTFESTFGNVAATGRVYKKRTIVLIDEASKAMFPGIEEQFNKLGGIGLSLGLYTQSQADMIMMLGKETATVIRDNINTVAYMKINDPNSKKEASQDFGQRKVLDYQMQMQGGIGGMGRAGIVAELQDIAHPDSFEELQIGESLVKHYGKRYFVQFPFQPAPKSFIDMPELDSEVVAREMLSFQGLLEEEMLYKSKYLKNLESLEDVNGAA